LALCAAVVGLLSGCGGSDANPKDVLHRTFGQPHTYASGQLDAHLLIDGQGLTGSNGKLELSLQGPFHSNGKGTVPSFSMKTGLALGTRHVDLVFTSDGKQMWLGLAGLQYTLPPQVFASFSKGWLGGSASKSGSILDRLGFQPSQWLANPETVGEEKVGGVEAVHVRSHVDGAALLDQFGTLLGTAGGAGGGLLNVPSLSKQQKAELAKSVKKAQIDVWSAKSDGSLRRLDVTVDVAPTGGQRETKLEFSFTISDLNQQQVINAPQKARPFTELSNMIASVSGSLGTGANSKAGGANAFEKCTQQAKSLEEAKKCSKVLTG
jgi:hypothetical protein